MPEARIASANQWKFHWLRLVDSGRLRLTAIPTCTEVLRTRSHLRLAFLIVDDELIRYEVITGKRIYAWQEVKLHE